MPVPSGMQWTREYLRKKGVPDQDITWNPQTSAVSVYGQELKPEYGEAGKSFASTANLDKFFSSLQPTFRMNQLMGQIDQLRNFRYNPQTDPSFQQAQKGITRNVMNTMQDRGMLLSTLTPERIAQTTAEALPQFESAAVQRNQQAISNLFNLVQTMQQQRQAEDEAKRQEQYAALNQLNALAGLTGKIPDVGAQFGLTPGALTASEQARRDTAARAAMGPSLSPLEQLKNDLLTGKRKLSDLTPEQQAFLNMGASDPLASAQKRLDEIAKIMTSSGWLTMPKDVKDGYLAEAQGLRAFIATGGQQQTSADQGLQESEIPTYIAQSRAAGLTDDQIRQRLAAYGYNPDQYLRKTPAKPKTSPWQQIYQSQAGVTNPMPFIGGMPYGQR